MSCWVRQIKPSNYIILIFNFLSDFIARLHGLHAAAVFPNSQSIKNSLQQMKHDINKRSSSTKSSTTASKQRTSTTTEISSAPRAADDDDYDDDDDDEDDEF